MEEVRAVIPCEPARGQILPQAEVTTTGYVDPRAYHNALHTPNLHYPVGALNSFDIHQGDLLFARVRSRYRAQGTYPRLMVFSNWAGLKKGEMPMYAGIAAADKITGTDSTLAYRLHGTCDVVYTGLVPIKQNDRIMWMPPAVITKNGLIEKCVHDDRKSTRTRTQHFRASMVPIKPGTPFAKLQEIKMRVLDLPARGGGEDRHQAAVRLEPAITKIWHEETPFYDLMDAKLNDTRSYKCPVRRFIMHCASTGLDAEFLWHAQPAGQPVYEHPGNDLDGLMKIVADYYVLVDGRCFAVANHDAKPGERLHVTLRV